jgi:hypothetical protein
MDDILSQMFIIARGDDIEGWMDILVLVILAVVYVLGSIIKAKGKKREGHAEKQLNRKPERKPSTKGRSLLEQFVREIQRASEPTRAPEPRTTAQPSPKKIVRPEAAVRKYADEAEQVTRTKPLSVKAKPKLSIPTPKVQPEFEEIPELGTSIQALPDFTGKTIEGLTRQRKGISDGVIESKYLSEVLSYFTDPEDLRMAILHYEILGRPLSLRDPSSQIIGL